MIPGMKAGFRGAHDAPALPFLNSLDAFLAMDRTMGKQAHSQPILLPAYWVRSF